MSVLGAKGRPGRYEVRRPRPAGQAVLGAKVVQRFASLDRAIAATKREPGLYIFDRKADHRVDVLPDDDERDSFADYIERLSDVSHNPPPMHNEARENAIAAAQEHLWLAIRLLEDAR